MRTLKNAGLVAAALVLAGSGMLAAQDTSYTRTPLPADTSAAPITDTVADTLRTDVSPTDTSGAAAAVDPYQAPGKATEEEDQGQHRGRQQEADTAVTAGDTLDVGAEGRVTTDPASVDADADVKADAKAKPEVPRTVPDSTKR